MSPLVGLSTASVYPEPTARGFEIAARLGYDAVEVMVALDPISQTAGRIKQLTEYYEIGVCAVHAPCLLLTQRVWGTEPSAKLERATEMALAVGADVVVVHPPFRWQREYADGFALQVAELERSTGLGVAVENMYPWRGPRNRKLQVYAPDWDPSAGEFANLTLDVSHAATAHDDILTMADRMGERLRHLHLADGSGSARDEHLIPGRGSQPVAELLKRQTARGFTGHLVLEVNTRKAADRRQRSADLAQALSFVRRHSA